MSEYQRRRRLPHRRPVLIAALWLAGCAGGEEAPRARVAAAASLTEAASTLFGDRAEISIGATSTLARQVAAGWDAEILLAAHPMWIDYLEERDLVLERRELCRNRLVLVGAPGITEFGWDDLAEGDVATGRIAIADTEHVPAGIYARQALTAAGLWERLAERLVPARDVRAALTYVTRGECELGLVYASDVRAAPGVHVLAAVPEAFAPSIRYEAALLRAAGAGGRGLFDTLQGEEAQAILVAHGFEPGETSVAR